MNNKGQITVEYILIIAVIITILLYTSNIIISESEKNTILSSAHIGAQIGVDKNSYAMYYNDTFNNYETNYPKLLNPNEIKIVLINLTENNKNIELEVVLHNNNYLTTNEKNIIGSRVNYYVRKTIAETFNQKDTDLYYENIKSKNYKINTKTVKWE